MMALATVWAAIQVSDQPDGSPRRAKGKGNVAFAGGQPVAKQAAAAPVRLLPPDKWRRVFTEENVSDLFSSHSWQPTQPPVNTEPPAPTAPPLPFKYFGKMQEVSGPLIVFLANGDRAYSVREGEVLDGTYRVDQTAGTQLVLTYLPLNIKQTLDIGGSFAVDQNAQTAPVPVAAQSVRPPEAAQVAPDPASTPGVNGAPVAVKTDKAAPAAALESIVFAWQGPTQAKVGEQFKLALRLKSDAGLVSLPFSVAFDPAVFQVVHVAEGGFFRQNNGTTSFATNVDQAGGKIFVGAARLGAEGAKGEDTLAIITLKALTPSMRGEVKLLGATPAGAGVKAPTPELPDPHVVAIGT